MGNYRIISSDDHIAEPADLWTSRVERIFRDRAPHIVRLEDGSDWWFTDGVQGMTLASVTVVGERFQGTENLSFFGQTEDVRPGGYDPHERIKDMDQDGIEVSVIYSNAGLNLYHVPDTELLNALFKTYNDWLAEYCSPYKNRLKGIALINLDDVEWGVRELERCQKLGLAGATIAAYQHPSRGYHMPEYEPFWAASQDLGMPLSLHISTNRAGSSGAVELTQSQLQPDTMCNFDYWVRTSLSQMIFGGVFERYPKLQVGSVEHEVLWALHFLERMDYLRTQRPTLEHWWKFKEDMLPSDYFRRNVFVGFQEDALAIKLREHIGVDCLQWGSDYPHMESTFPRSQEILQDILADCTEDEKSKIVCGNASRVYHLN